MNKRRKTILGPVYSVAPAEGGNGGAGGAGAGGQLPPGVAPNSAAATAFPAADAAPGADDANRAGGQDALKADLAKERTRRHEMEAQLKALTEGQTKQLDAFKAALGLKPEETTTEQLQATLQKQQAEHQAAMTQLTVHQLATAAGADPVALLDSRSFLESISKLQPTDAAGIAAAITAATEKNSQLLAVKPGAGTRDAAQGGGAGGTKPSMSDLIRAAAGK